MNVKSVDYIKDSLHICSVNSCTDYRHVTMETLKSLTHVELFVSTLKWSEGNGLGYHITIRTYCLLCELLNGLKKMLRNNVCTILDGAGR